jgi:hypothetical protein
MHKAPLVAVDTNFPLLLAKGLDEAQDALVVLRERVRPAAILVPPTALEELRELDLPVPLIVSPREIVRKFYR